MSYDVIGDIHGHAEALEAMLRKLGYREHLGVWRHPGRTAVFLGDFIDRGPAQLETLRTVRRMIDAGSALSVMGNHELNAIAFHTPDPDVPGEFLRRHHSPKYGDKNRRQHAAFLAAVEHRPSLHRELTDWFLTLPLWLDLPPLRVVHACWHARFLPWLEPQLRPGRALDDALLVAATREPADEAEKDTPEPTVFKAVEALLKGVEIPMPPGYTFTDKDGIVRDRVRLKWWDAEARTYGDAVFIEGAAAAGEGRAAGNTRTAGRPHPTPLSDVEIPAAARLGYPAQEKPVFVGHYWLRGEPARLAPNVACLDYSIAKGGQLCAYRFDGEPALEDARFVAVGG